MGFETIAIARGADKEANARELGAHHYIDSRAEDVAAAMQALGGAAVVLATAANSPRRWPTLVGGLAAEGELVIVGVTADPLPIAPIQLITPVCRCRGTRRARRETLRRRCTSRCCPAFAPGPRSGRWPRPPRRTRRWRRPARYRMVLDDVSRLLR